ncbi:hypothetical protein H7691_12395 [Stenotrophomonas sp. CW117]|uniref:hypothetical protein n=1 Tax=Stenotrophomonas TaxID=40323 RepID=UPI000AD1B833|nr:MULTISPECIES: hypothetical protein [Stenotrophomonas]QOF97437.1 hypothetical protein H7691_12395 [Stenotrophomonas sp. CW117]
METILQIALVLTLFVVATAALKQYRRARLDPYVRSLQRATLALCAGVMEDGGNSAKSRDFARRMAVLVMSDTILTDLGKNREKMLSFVEGERSKDRDSELRLSAEDMKIVQPALHAFAMACLLYDPKYSGQVRRLWEGAMAQAYARANAVRVAPQSVAGSAATKAAKEAPKPVEEKLQKVEGVILERLSDLCLA